MFETFFAVFGFYCFCAILIRACCRKTQRTGLVMYEQPRTVNIQINAGRIELR